MRQLDSRHGKQCHGKWLITLATTVEIGESGKWLNWPTVSAPADCRHKASKDAGKEAGIKQPKGTMQGSNQKAARASKVEAVKQEVCRQWWVKLWQNWSLAPISHPAPLIQKPAAENRFERLWEMEIEPRHSPFALKLFLATAFHSSHRWNCTVYTILSMSRSISTVFEWRGHKQNRDGEEDFWRGHHTRKTWDGPAWFIPSYFSPPWRVSDPGNVVGIGEWGGEDSK